jgi:hypothetical protein
MLAMGCAGAKQDDSAVESRTSALTAGGAGDTTASSSKASAVTAVPVAATASAPVVPSRQTVWVVMKNQANLAQLSTARDWKGRGQAVYTGLTTNASASQAGLKSFLLTRSASFKPFWISNTVKVTADQATIDEIGKRSDVARILPDRTYTLPPLQPSALSITATEWNISNIRAPEVWDQFGARGEGIVVANIDTGVQFDHPALVRQYRGNRGDGTFDHN